MEPHQHRQVAESFGTDAERYDRTRPSYPEAMVDRIVATSPGPDVLDVGAGTGIAARQFAAAGCTNVSFQLGRTNDEARRFYARCGYAPRVGYELMDKTLNPAK